MWKNTVWGRGEMYKKQSAKFSRTLFFGILCDAIYNV